VEIVGETVLVRHRAVRADAGARHRAATRALIPDPAADRSLQQVVNVAELPGIVTASYAIPDVRCGYRDPRPLPGVMAAAAN
jgi:RNA-splicing ligase RtcB